MAKPTIVKTIPDQVTNVQAAFGPIKLTEYIQTDDQSSVQFTAQLKDGSALPKGLIVTSDGLLTGIAAKGTEGSYEVIVTANAYGADVTSQFVLTINPSLTTSSMAYFNQVKAQIWQALEKRLPPPNFADFYHQDITEIDIYYLLERWGTLIVWDAFNLQPPSGRTRLTLAGTSPHYNVYDCGSCIIAAPKDLYDHKRTLADGLQTARAVAREVYQRNWTIELSGLAKYTRAAWLEIQQLIDKYGKSLEIINYDPSPKDVQLYVDQMQANRMRGGMD